MMTRTAIRPFKILAGVGAAFLLWGLVLAYASSPAWAADITVNTTADNVTDDDLCSLREAITTANSDTTVGVGGADADCVKGSGEDTIYLPLGTIKLAASLGRLPITTSAITVDGGSAKPTISGDQKVQVFEVNSGATLTLSNLTVADGNSSISGVGGGIANNGTLVVNNSTISGNTAWYDGGGIYNT